MLLMQQVATPSLRQGAPLTYLTTPMIKARRAVRMDAVRPTFP